MKKIKVRVHGRPGWHIECSIMSQKFLRTETLDIHAGGRDLIFPHHENEIAQSEALTDKPFAKYWMHHGLLTINGQKMAKSLGNFVTIKDFIAKYGDADTLKLFFLSVHYAHPIDYSEEKISETKQALERILILMDKVERKVKGKRLNLKSKNFKELDDIKDKFIEAMDDDFNTPQALASIFDLVNIANKNISNSEFIFKAKDTIEELLGILGVSLQVKRKLFSIADEEIKVQVLKRERARRNKDFTLADKIRKELEEKGIILEDQKDKTIWRRKFKIGS